MHKLKLSEEFLAKVRKDFNTLCEKKLMSVDETDWLPYKAGYIDCLKRFGGCTRPHKEPWEGAIDRMSGAFDQSEIDEANAWR